MRRVYKYPLTFGPGQTQTTLELPYAYQFLHFGFQDGNPIVWALVNPDNPSVQRTLRVVGTGWDLEEGSEHRGTAIEGDYVWHLFEMTP